MNKREKRRKDRRVEKHAKEEEPDETSRRGARPLPKMKNRNSEKMRHGTYLASAAQGLS